MRDSDFIPVDRPAQKPAETLYNIQHLSDLSKLFHLLDKRPNPLCRSLLIGLAGSIFFIAAPCTAVDNSSPGARWQALAGAGVAAPGLSAAPFENPASLAEAPPWLMGSSAGRPFGLAELTAWQIGCSHSWRRSGLGLALQNFGYSLYRESSAALALAYGFPSGLNFGLTLRHTRIAIDRYGSAGAWLCDFGGQLRCSGRLRAGFFLRNLFAAALGRCREELPQSLQSGFAVTPSPATSLCIDLYMEKGLPLELRCGLEQVMGEWLALRAGFTSASQRLAAGFALRQKHLSIEYGAMTHPWLGLSHQFALLYRPGGQAQK
jgi:hypothetical protein